jgi:hypothetical protein
MLDFHLIFAKPVQKLILNVWSIDVDWHLNGYLLYYLDWDLSIDVDRNLSVYVDGLVYIHDLLCDGWNLDGSDDLFLHLEWYFLLDFNVFRDFYDFLDDPLRSRDGLEYLNNYLNRLLYDNFLDNFLGDDALMPVNLCVPVFQKLSHHIQFHLKLILFAL